MFYDVTVTDNLDHSERGPCDPGYSYDTAANECEGQFITNLLFLIISWILYLQSRFFFQSDFKLYIVLANPCIVSTTTLNVPI